MLQLDVTHGYGTQTWTLIVQKPGNNGHLDTSILGQQEVSSCSFLIYKEKEQVVQLSSPLKINVLAHMHIAYHTYH